MTRKNKSRTTVKAADSGARGKSRSAPKPAAKSPDLTQERPSASEPSLPDANMPDPTRRDRPAPASPPADTPTSDKDQGSPVPGENQRPAPVEEPAAKPPVRASDEDDFVTPPPHSAPQPHDDVEGRPGQTSEVRDNVGPRADIEPEAADKTADAAHYTLDQMRDVIASMTSGFADLRLAGDGLRTMTQAAQSAAVNGLCAFAEEFQSLTRDAVERQTEATHALMSVKSLPEAWEVQYRMVQQAMENYTGHIRQLNAIGINTMQQAAEPVTSGMTESLSRFWKLRAA